MFELRNIQGYTGRWTRSPVAVKAMKGCFHREQKVGLSEEKQGGWWSHKLSPLVVCSRAGIIEHGKHCCRPSHAKPSGFTTWWSVCLHCCVWKIWHILLILLGSNQLHEATLCSWGFTSGKLSNEITPRRERQIKDTKSNLSMLPCMVRLVVV